MNFYFIIIQTIIDQAIDRWWFGLMAWVIARGGHFEHWRRLVHCFTIALNCWFIRFILYMMFRLNVGDDNDNVQAYVTYNWRRLWHVYACCVSQGIIKTLCKGDWRSTVGGTPVFGRRTDPVLRSTFSWWVTTMWVNRPLKISQLNLSSFLCR